jgi:PAS domain S-box-containing protein
MMNNLSKNFSNLSDSRMRVLLESTNSIPWVIDWATKEFTYIGPQVEKVLGYPRESWVDASVWAERIHPEDRDRVVNLCISQSESGEEHHADYRAIAHNGRVVWIRDVVHVIREGMVTKEITGYMFDITESKLAEEELAFAKNSLEKSNYALEKLARGESINEIFDILTMGAESNIKGSVASILLLDHFGSRLIDGSTPSFSQAMKDAFNGMLIGPLAGSCGTAAYSKQLVIVEDIGTDPRWAQYKDFAHSQGLKSCYSAPILGSDGSVLGTFALTFKESKPPSDFELEIIRSSTHIASLAIERKRYEENLQIYAKELEDFTSIASHDLQEPLRKIISFGDLIDSGISESDERSRNYLRRMQSAALRMRNLVDDLLQFTTMGSKENSFERTDLRKVTVSVLEDLETRINECHGQVNIKNLPVIDADPVQMYQLFLNLIGNALKYHREGVPPVITLDHTCEGNGSCVILVEDNGIGIEEEHVDKIFKPFERLHGRSTYEGTGIGLTICNKIVSRHGGKITVKRQSTNGVTFRITLPEKQNKGEVI